MINRLNEESAKNEARMEVALESLDTQTMEIEANAEKLRAHELVEQFKLEMNSEAVKTKKSLASGTADKDKSTQLNSLSSESSEEESSELTQQVTKTKKSIGSKLVYLSKETKYNEFKALKNVWKQHYAEIKALKTDHKNAVRSTKITRALQSVEASLSRLRLTNDEINSQALSNSSIADLNPDKVSENQQDSPLGM